MIDSDKAWQAVLRRDRSFDGRFVTGVLTTGIYCRPSCAARHPARSNVRFFVDGAEARVHGLRACKRCLPDDVARDEAAVLAAIDEIRQAEDAPSLAVLARITDYSPSHFQRVFKRATGLSPAAYARALREERARDALSSGDSVTRAIYEAGYGSASRFYEGTKGKLGMSASDWRDGGSGRTIHWTTVDTSLGPMLVAATDKGVCCLSFNEGEDHLRARFPKADMVEGGADFRTLFEAVTSAVEQPSTATTVDIPLDVKGTAFQQRVWEALRQIPAGETLSYGELAAAVGNPKASRAVGGANGANNIAVLIPCHRVIAADGGLGGYAYGTAIKAELLRREQGD
ncbi:bifunctional DNA-binding transcriptional regulator/O6-methylguanine-DNA methyltransferase Ada [Qipengyuania gaetbuli]|uniref:bifunctional DNA-binding transcriptional regulator/O6-methylguanine-DNA methyltransferase Ada n=1 Tax=Qipengyuania gaetbuli TaxID=266952 RepID=UPI001CD65AE6|nr:bifunctional DNA-binding transcriptional regulator/O6-methylguanine-DNA methyltransferase Ada [Qipengyuania gaetbuli]MCA0910924.1 bifunctional DNA-binding transcriptional regulator/O6-methylguanine-DNA methyltransferase Ada [Qipengyuania gaetbuli]